MQNMPMNQAADTARPGAPPEGVEVSFNTKTISIVGRIETRDLCNRLIKSLVAMREMLPEEPQP